MRRIHSERIKSILTTLNYIQTERTLNAKPMAPKLSILFVGLVVACFSTVAQVHNCKIKIIKLKFERDLNGKTGELTDSLLALATLTTTILLDNSSIKKFSIKTDTAC